MQGLQRFVFTAVLIAWHVAPAWAQDVQPEASGIGEPVPINSVLIAERAEANISAYSAAGLSFRVREIKVPGASFIKLHFSQFSLPEGVEVEISNPDGSESWIYAHDQPKDMTVDADMGDDGINSFSAMSITGDTVVVRITGDLRLLDPLVHRLEIDSWLEGLPLGESRLSHKGRKKDDFGKVSQTENTCGSDERYDSICWASSNPWEYNRSAAVAKLITSKGEVCTAWRVGSDNHMFTAEHCVGKQSELDGSEIWFNYESTSCGGSGNTSAVKVTGGTLLSRSSSLDYSLFTVNNFSSISQFPAFGLETDTPPLGEPIFIPQHGLGQPRQIALESDMNASGECEVDANDLDGYASNSDIGYYCDTATSSSGSPVVSNISGRVIALHHFGGCLNTGVKMSLIWPQVKSHFGGQIPSGNSGGSSNSGNNAPKAEFSFECDNLSCSFDGGNSVDSDGEIVAFTWDLGNGGNEIKAAFEYEYPEGGTYDVTLTVEDDEGDTATATQSVTVEFTNIEPRATFSTSCISNRCEFDASRSYDEDGEIESMFWMLGDGSTATGFVVEHLYEEAGSYNVQLTATDNEGSSDSSMKQVTVVLPNQAPTASFEFNCIDLDCSLDASGSSDVDGELVAWAWSFGDGSTADGVQISHSYQEAGSFEVNLTVTDNRGGTDSSTRAVSVTQAPPEPEPAPEPEPEPAPEPEPEPAPEPEPEPAPEPEPQPVLNESPHARFSYDCDERKCTFDAGSSRDPNGSITSYRWSMGDGADLDGMAVQHDFEASGTYQVTLTVVDNEGKSDLTSRNIEVEEDRPDITLIGSGRQNNSRSVATLRWSGAESGRVDLYRDGILIANTLNDGKLIDTAIDGQMKSAVYQLCQAESEICSNALVISFNKISRKQKQPAATTTGFPTQQRKWGLP